MKVYVACLAYYLIIFTLLFWKDWAAKGYEWLAVVALAFLGAIFLASCGENFATFEKPAGDFESEWHRCMRQHSPLGREACKSVE